MKIGIFFLLQIQDNVLTVNVNFQSMPTPTPDILNYPPGEMSSLPLIEKLQQNIPH